jgi:hypothetical protein
MQILVSTGVLELTPEGTNPLWILMNDTVCVCVCVCKNAIQNI